MPFCAKGVASAQHPAGRRIGRRGQYPARCAPFGATWPFTPARGIVLAVRFVADDEQERQAVPMRRDQPVERVAPGHPYGPVGGPLRCNQPLRQIGGRAVRALPAACGPASRRHAAPRRNSAGMKPGMTTPRASSAWRDAISMHPVWTLRARHVKTPGEGDSVPACRTVAGPEQLRFALSALVPHRRLTPPTARV